MSIRKDQEPALNEYGDETHPAFGKARVNRVSSTPGASLFGSEIRHSQYVVLTIERATRKRDLNRDWIHGGGRLPVVEVAMSEAQWAGLVSSFGSGGVPVTITGTEADPIVPAIPFAPRMEHSQRETRQAADKAFAEIADALAAYEAHKTAGNLRTLHYAVANAGANVEFAAKSLTEHAENVVEKARADIEAMVVSHANRLKLTEAQRPALALEMTADADG